MTTCERFDRLYLHDSSIQQINLDVWERTCVINLTYAGVMKSSETTFNYESFFKPAMLTFTDVKEIDYPEGYCMKTEILNHEAAVSGEYPGYFCYSLILAEGKNRDTFTTTIMIIARDFSLRGTPSELPLSR